MKPTIRLVPVALLLVLMSLAFRTHALEVSSEWALFSSTDGSTLTARHESAAVVVGDAIYLIGGRGSRPIERYSPTTGQWENLGGTPLEIHHLQPVAVGKRIYIVGAFTCCYPDESTVAEIQVFDTETNLWDTAGSIPDDRLRGSVGTVVYQNKIYIVGGNTLGHNGGAVAWFDEYDPATGNWRALADAPHARDHFSAVVVGNKLIAAAGRQTAMPNPAANPVAETDVYDFSTNTWTVAASIPTVRGGVAAVARGSEVLVAGGEINTSSSALSAVESYNTATDTWQTLPSMTVGRHGAGGGIIGNSFFMLSGATSIGGAAESETAEVLELPDLIGTDTTGTDTAGTDTAGTDTAGTDTAGTDTAGTDTAGTDTAGTDPSEAPVSNSKRGGAGFLMLSALLAFVATRRLTAER